ncbi:unnamed protein product, partial [Ectocarpus sp. 12 AP-2014]
GEKQRGGGRSLVAWTPPVRTIFRGLFCGRKGSCLFRCSTTCREWWECRNGGWFKGSPFHFVVASGVDPSFGVPGGINHRFHCNIRSPSLFSIPFSAATTSIKDLTLNC